MNHHIFVLLSGALAVFSSGCATQKTAHYYGTKPIQEYKTSYVVVTEGNDKNVVAGLVQALGQHGVQATSGPAESKPKDVQFYVNFDDSWNWDLAMYLRTLDVHFFDNATGTLIATAGFAPQGAHGFPDPKKMAVALVDQIYGTPH